MKVDLYTGIHKGMRSLTARYALRAGTVDWMQMPEVSQAAHEWQTVHRLVNVHHEAEERYIHPLLAQAIPGGRRPFDEEHHAIAVVMDDLSGHVGRLANGGAVRNRREVGLEFYRGVNRFCAHFLAHLDREETQAQRALDDTYPPQELAATNDAVIASIPRDDMMLFIDNVFPALSLPEAAGLLSAVHLPPQVFDVLAERVRRALGEADWARVQALLAVPQPAAVG